MTREEAIAKVRAVPDNETRDSLRGGLVYSYSTPFPVADVLVDRLIALGLLKLEEPKTVEEEAVIELAGMPVRFNRFDAPVPGYLGVLDAKMVVSWLRAAGFKIVRET